MPFDDDADDSISEEVALAEPVLLAAQRELIPLLLQLSAKSPRAAHYAIETLNRRLRLLADASRPMTAAGHQWTADPSTAYASAPAGRGGPRHLKDWQHLPPRERTQLRRYVLLAELEQSPHPMSKQDLVAAVHREGFDADAGDSENAIATQLSRMKETRQVASPQGTLGRFTITDGGKDELAKLRIAYVSNLRTAG